MTDGQPEYWTSSEFNQILFTGHQGATTSKDILIPEGWVHHRVPTHAERMAERSRKRVEFEAEARGIIIAHEDLVGSSDGLRRAVLEMHAPEPEERENYVGCAKCMQSSYEECAEPFPCSTYTLARGWPE